MLAIRKMSVALFALMLAFGAQVAVSTTAQASPQGELVASTHSNSPSALDNGCGNHVVKFYNASNAPIFSARLLITITLDFKKKERPFRGSVKKSWVSYKMYLAPGGTAYFEADLCTSIPKRRFSNNAFEWASFSIAKVKWSW